MLRKLERSECSHSLLVELQIDKTFLKGNLAACVKSLYNIYALCSNSFALEINAKDLIRVVY